MKRLVLILGVLLFGGSLVQAIPVTVKITGVVTDIRDLEDYAYDEIILIGDTFTGTYTYDSSTLDLNSDAGIGNYVHNSPYGFDISLGGFAFKTVESHVGQYEISILNDFSLQPYDRYIVESTQNDPLSTGLNVNSIIWDIYDGTHTAISSTNLPLVAPDIDTWGGGTFLIGCGGPPHGNATFAVWGTVMQAVLIPEPATLALLGLGGLLST